MVDVTFLRDLGIDVDVVHELELCVRHDPANGPAACRIPEPLPGEAAAVLRHGVSANTVSIRSFLAIKSIFTLKQTLSTTE